VQQLDEETIKQLADVIVAGSHGLIKKKEGADCLNLQIKGDSFVVESAIHFPTDLNLLWDCCRKSIEKMEFFQSSALDLGLRFHCRKWYKKARKAYRKSSEIHRKKGANYQQRLEESVVDYLEIGHSILGRGEKMLLQLVEKEALKSSLAKIKKQHLSDFAFYLKMLKKHLDLVHRRIILGEKMRASVWIGIFILFLPNNLCKNHQPIGTQWFGYLSG